MSFSSLFRRFNGLKSSLTFTTPEQPLYTVFYTVHSKIEKKIIVVQWSNHPFQNQCFKYILIYNKKKTMMIEWKIKD